MPKVSTLPDNPTAPQDNNALNDIDIRNDDAHCAGQCGAPPNISTTSHAFSNSTVTQPEIQSINAYIERHYKERLINELCALISDGDVPADTACTRPRPIRTEPYPDTGNITKVTCMRLSQTSLQADILITLDLAIHRIEKGTRLVEYRTQWYRVDMYIDMEADIFIEYGRFRIYRHEAHDNACFLSEYLIPFFNMEKLEQEAERILGKYCPDMLSDTSAVNAYRLAGQMGLHIVELPLYDKDSRESILFFIDGEVLTQECDTAPIIPLPICANTIVLNTRYASAEYGSFADAIFHECVHFEEHYLFFRLQKNMPLLLNLCSRCTIFNQM